MPEAIARRRKIREKCSCQLEQVESFKGSGNLKFYLKLNFLQFTPHNLLRTIYSAQFTPPRMSRYHFTETAHLFLNLIEKHFSKFGNICRNYWLVRSRRGVTRYVTFFLMQMILRNVHRNTDGGEKWRVFVQMKFFSAEWELFIFFRRNERSNFIVVHFVIEKYFPTIFQRNLKLKKIIRHTSPAGGT